MWCVLSKQSPDSLKSLKHVLWEGRPAGVLVGPGQNCLFTELASWAKLAVDAL